MPQKPPNKRALPFTLRLTPEERTILKCEAEAMDISLGEYIRHKALQENRVKRKSRRKSLIKDHALLAQVLAMLGSTRIPNHHEQLAKAVNSGSLVLTPDAKTAILEGCADIREIKVILDKALKD